MKVLSGFPRATSIDSGGERFGWKNRNPELGKTRDGRWFIGLGAATGYRDSPVVQKFGFNPINAVFEDGRVREGARSVTLADAGSGSGLVAEEVMEFGELAKKYQQTSFGAHFVEIGVDAATGEIRVRRMLAVCAAGRIITPKDRTPLLMTWPSSGQQIAIDARGGAQWKQKDSWPHDNNQSGDWTGDSRLPR